MKRLFIPIIVFVVLVAGNLRVAAEVRLPSILGSHMVLQQKSEVNLWGWCSPSEKIYVKTSWDTTKYVTK
ncbi:MAG: MmpS family protein, partial [Bacteroidetes bacterium]|nr:MmpS family protein [Bacteroidota bacterium]